MTKRAKKQIVEPSKSALETVAEMARKAARDDDWMQPVMDDIIGNSGKREALKDFGQATGYHRDGWGETNHFIILYAHEIAQVALEEALRFGVGRSLSDDGKFWVGSYKNWESYHHEIYVPLLEEFWDTWEEEVNLYEAWKHAVEVWHLNTYNLFTGIYWPGMKRKIV